MFDVIAGLPVHPLVIHAVVALAPLTAVMLLVYTFTERSRPGLKWPLVVFAAVTAFSAWVAEASGEKLEHRLGEPHFEHAEKGELAAKACFLLFAVTLLVVFVLARRASSNKLFGISGMVVSVLAAAFLAFAVFTAGHSGAESVWKDEISKAPSPTQSDGTGD